MWDLSSPTRTWTHTPCSGSYGPSTTRVLDWVHFWLTQLLAPHAITAEGLILFIYSVFELRKSSITVSNLFVHLALNSSRVPEFQPWRNALVFVTVSAESLSPFPWALWSHLLPLACLQQYWPLSSSDKPRTCSPQVLCSCLEYSPLRFLCGCFLLSSCLCSNITLLGRLTLTPYTKDLPHPHCGSPWCHYPASFCFFLRHI